MSVLDEAMRLHRAGCCVLPLALDGMVRPALTSWKVYKAWRPSTTEVEQWFTGRYPGLAVVGGTVSDGLECLDFDNHAGRGCVFRPWLDGLSLEAARKLIIYRTPRAGWRACYRCQENLGHKAKEVLARRSKDDVLIELLGCQVAAVPGGHPNAHRTGKPYTYARGHLAEVQEVTPAERAEMLDLGRQFNIFTPPAPERQPRPPVEEGTAPNPWTPWGDYILRTTWDEVLTPKGWAWAGDRGGVSAWRRPGKWDGISATTNFADLDLLHVFSSSTEFQADKSYNRAAAYAVLYHDGDFRKATKELARLGYGRANYSL